MTLMGWTRRAPALHLHHSAHSLSARCSQPGASSYVRHQAEIHISQCNRYLSRCNASLYPSHEVNERVGDEPSKYNRRKCHCRKVDPLLWWPGSVARHNLRQLPSIFEAAVQIVRWIVPTTFVAPPK